VSERAKQPDREVGLESLKFAADGGVGRQLSIHASFHNRLS